MAYKQELWDEAKRKCPDRGEDSEVCRGREGSKGRQPIQLWFHLTG